MACLLALLLVLILMPAPPAAAAIGAVWNVSKTVVPSIATPGSQVTYTITVYNAGDDKDNIDVTDYLPSGFTIASLTYVKYFNHNGMAGGATASGNWGYSTSGTPQVVSFNRVNNVDYGYVMVWTLKANISAGQADGAYPNRVYLHGVGGINRDVDTGSTATVTVGDPPVLVTTKSYTSPGGTVAENSLVHYRIRVTNTGGGTATNVVVSDSLPATFSYDAVGPPAYTPQVSLNGGAGSNLAPTSVVGNVVTWSLGSLAGNNAYAEIEFQARTGTGTASHGTWTNTVDVSSSNAVPTTSGATAPVTVVDPITMAVSKTITASNLSPAGPPYDANSVGTPQLTYKITITNTSPAGTAQNIKVVDDLPGTTGWVYDPGSSNKGNPNVVGNQLIWNDIGSLAAGASTTVTFRLLLPQNQSGTFNNTATISGSNFAPVTTGPTAPAPLVGPQYTITKSASITSGTLGVNNDFIYTIEVTNTGTGSGTYRVTDVLPAGTTMQPWSTGPTRYYEYDSNIAGGAAATTSATAPTGYPGTSSATMTFPTSAGSFTIAAGITDRIRFRARLNTSIDGVYYNQAGVTDTKFINATADTGLAAGIQMGTPPTMLIGKSVDKSLVLPLDYVFYTIRVTNNSPAGGTTATNVSISDTLPGGFYYQPGTTSLYNSATGVTTNPTADPTGTSGTITWSNLVASLPPQKYVDVTFKVQVSTSPGSYDNLATTFGTNYGNIGTGNTATVVVGNPPTLTISKTTTQLTPITLGVQTDVPYTITVTNAGSVAATSPTITDTLPTGTTYRTGTSQLNTGAGFAATGDPSGSTGTITWSGLSDIPAGGSLTLTFTVRFPSTMSSGTYPDTATAAGSNASTVSTGPTAPVTVGSPPNMRIAASTSSSSVNASGTFTYTITITNPSAAPTPSTGQLSRVTAILPLGMAYQAGTTGWTNGGASAPTAPVQSGTDPMVLNWDFPSPLSVTVGTSVTLSFTVQVLATAVQANGASQGYYIEAQTIGQNYGLITTGFPPNSATSGSSAPPLIKVTSSSAVSLVNLVAVAKPGIVDLHWQSGSEFQNLAFQVQRGPHPNGPFEPVGQPLVTGLGSSGTGGVYHLSDPTVASGETYYYSLVAYEFGGLRTTYGPLRVKVPATGNDSFSLEKGANAPTVATTVPTVPSAPRTADVRTYAQVVAQDDTGLTLRLVTPTVQVHTADGTTRAIIDKLPLVSKVGQYLLPEAVIPLGLPADVPYRVSVVAATDAVTVGDVRLSVTDVPPPPNTSSNAVALTGTSPTPPAVTSSASPVAVIAPPPQPAPTATATPTTTAAGSSGSTRATLQQSHLQFAFGVLATISGPPGLVEAEETAQARNQRILQLKLYPVQYDAAAATLTQYRDLTVRLTFERPATLVTATSTRNLYDAAFDRLMTDYDLFSRWEAAPEPRTDSYTTFGGPAFRVTVRGEGLVQLAAAELAAAGVELGHPTTLRLFYRNRELPLDVAVSNGMVQHVRFFAPANTTAYSRDTVLFLVNDQVDGKRMATWDGTPGTGPRAVSYDATLEQADSAYFWRQMPADGRSDYWFHDYLDLAFTNKPTSDVTFTLNGVVAAATTDTWLEVGLRGEVKEAKVPLNNHVGVTLNGRQVGDLLWSGTDYLRRRLPLPNDLVFDGANTVRLTLRNDRGAQTPVALVDSVTLHVARRWQAENGRLLATVTDPAEATFGTTGLQGASAAVYDVTDPDAVRRATGITTAGPVAFADPGATGAHRYWIGDATGMVTARLAPLPAWDSLHATQQADYLVITPAAFREQAQRLADYRSLTGLRTRVVDVQAIFDEFAGGHPEPDAIRDFLSWTQSNWEAPAPTYVVLLGDGSFDYRNDYGDDPATLTTLIPPHQRASLHIGLTPDDNWFASAVGDDELPDLFIGRLPAASLAEATTMVDKIIAFETGDAAWKRQAVTVSDDNDVAFRQMADAVRLGYPAAFGWQSLTVADRSALRTALESGTGMTLYVGHGATDLWADEQVLTNDGVDALAETDRAGFVVAASCLTAYFHDPYLPSLGETMLRKAHGGAAAYLGGSGYTLPAAQAIMLKRFYRFLLTDRLSIGAAMTMAKIGLFMDDAPLWSEEIASWTLLGDPAMTLTPPPTH